MKRLLFAALLLLTVSMMAQPTQPMVAIHVSELTQALATAPATGVTPTGTGTTGYQWWTPWWHYRLMPESVREALNADGTQTVTVSDADIAAGSLLTASGAPKYPIVISLAAEAVSNTEATQLSNYVAAGGFLMVGSSAFTRNPDGSSRGDFALASQMGLHTAAAGLQNWAQNSTLTQTASQRLVSHIPSGTLFWQMPLTEEDVSWGTSPHPTTLQQIEASHYLWQTHASTATVVATADGGVPYIAYRNYGNGYFIYDAAMQPLVGDGGFAPGMYAYRIFRNAVEWAFEANNIPLVKLSPWPYPYNAAYAVRHDFEDFQSNIAAILSSAQVETSFGALGDYYFCTGTLRQEMNNDPTVIANMRTAVSQYGATIGSHNGGLPNPANQNLWVGSYDYWHWGPDEALDTTPAGYASGAAYTQASITQSFADLDGWLSSVQPVRRNWVAPYFNATRESSMQILGQLGVITAGEQKLSSFPHWTVSLKNPSTRYSFVTLPVSDWFVGTNVAQSMESHSVSTVNALVDEYYSFGGLINLYSHLPSTDTLVRQYIGYSSAKAAIWPVNANIVYQWWQKRSSVVLTPSYSLVSGRAVATVALSGATDPNTAIELEIPNYETRAGGLQVKFNGSYAPANSYRAYNGGIKILTGTSVSTVEVSYPLTPGPAAQDDSYASVAGVSLGVSAPGVLGNDTNQGSGTLSAVLAVAPSHGSLTLNANGSFTYTANSNFTGTDSFRYYASNGTAISDLATVSLSVSPLLSTLAVTPAAIESGTTATGTVTLNAPAPAGGVSTPLSSDNASAASVPASVTVPAGASSASFTVTAGTVSATATANLSAAFGGTVQSAALLVTPAASNVLFTDSFSGANGPDSLWTTYLGSWNISNGVFNGTSNPYNYAYAYVPASWTDYSVQAQVQFPAGAYGGGIGGRLNSSTGAHYALWIYPEASFGGAANIKLIKFSNWTAWTQLAEASLPSIGTTAHAAQLTLQGSSIQASFDGTTYINYTDAASPLASGGISLDFWNPATAYNLTVDNVLVQGAYTAPVAQNDSYSTAQGSTLTTGTAAGVLTNDSTGGSGTMTATLISGPSHGSLSLQSDGSFAYTPVPTYNGTDSFTYQAVSAGMHSATATVTITVTAMQVGQISVPQFALLSGTTATGTVTLNAAAPSGGITVTLASDNTSLATVPGSVTIPAGSSSATFTVTAGTAAAVTNLHLSATYAGTSRSTLMTILPSGSSILFLDGFSGANGPDSLWTSYLGSWNINNGAFNGTGNPYNYAYAYVPASWTDYSVQAQVQFPAGAYAGGIGGRLNSSTGAHYALWIYPEASSGGAANIKLIKFSNWTAWTQLAEASLPSIGTTAHAVQLTLQGSSIQASFDGTTYINYTDAASPLASGGISLDFWNPATAYTLTVDNVLVRY